MVHSREIPFRCPKWSKVISQATHLRRHMMVHTGETPFPCPQCPKSFALKASLQVWEFAPEKKPLAVMVHAGEIPFRCPKCSKIYFLRQLIYTEKNPLAVPSAQKYFPWQPIYVEIWWFILGRPLFSQCPKSFALKANLQVFLGKHLGEKPFFCSWCPKLFSRKANLQAHLRTHKREKYFRCFQSFALKGNVQVHLRFHT